MAGIVFFHDGKASDGLFFDYVNSIPPSWEFGNGIENIQNDLSYVKANFCIINDHNFDLLAASTEHGTHGTGLLSTDFSKIFEKQLEIFGALRSNNVDYDASLYSNLDVSTPDTPRCCIKDILGERDIRFGAD